MANLPDLKKELDRARQHTQSALFPITGALEFAEDESQPDRYELASARINEAWMHLNMAVTALNSAAVLALSLQGDVSGQFALDQLDAGVSPDDQSAA